MEKVENISNVNLIIKLQTELKKYSISKTNCLPLGAFLSRIYEIPAYAELWQDTKSSDSVTIKTSQALISELAERYVLEQRLVLDYCFSNLIIIPLKAGKEVRLLSGDYKNTHIVESIMTDGQVITKVIEPSNPNIKNLNIYHPSYRERVKITAPGEFLGEVIDASYILKRTSANNRVIGLQLRINDLKSDISPILKLAKEDNFDELVASDVNIEPYVYIRKRVNEGVL